MGEGAWTAPASLRSLRHWSSSLSAPSSSGNCVTHIWEPVAKGMPTPQGKNRKGGREW
jgi:hypothetical protein